MVTGPWIRSCIIESTYTEHAPRLLQEAASNSSDEDMERTALVDLTRGLLTCAIKGKQGTRLLNVRLACICYSMRVARVHMIKPNATTEKITDALF